MAFNATSYPQLTGSEPGWL